MENVGEARTNANGGIESSASFQQLAYDYVKARIMRLELKPGAYLTDTQVAAERAGAASARDARLIAARVRGAPARPAPGDGGEPPAAATWSSAGRPRAACGRPRR